MVVNIDSSLGVDKMWGELLDVGHVPGNGLGSDIANRQLPSFHGRWYRYRIVVYGTLDHTPLVCFPAAFSPHHHPLSAWPLRRGQLLQHLPSAAERLRVAV